MSRNSVIFRSMCIGFGGNTAITLLGWLFVISNFLPINFWDFLFTSCQFLWCPHLAWSHQFMTQASKETFLYVLFTLPFNWRTRRSCGEKDYVQKSDLGVFNVIFDTIRYIYPHFTGQKRGDWCLRAVGSLAWRHETDGTGKENIVMCFWLA